jgi:hypothetical protein
MPEVPSIKKAKNCSDKPPASRATALGSVTVSKIASSPFYVLSCFSFRKFRE